MQTLSYTQPDELSDLFRRQFTLANQQPATPTEQFDFATAQPPQPIYYSQHYTQTAHVRLKSAQEAIPRLDDSLRATLRQHDINPDSLLPAQIQLFQSAPYDERLRLLELWRIAPPEYGSRELAEQVYSAWPQTNMTQEEEMAKQRYERRLNERERLVIGTSTYSRGNNPSLTT